VHDVKQQFMQVILIRTDKLQSSRSLIGNKNLKIILVASTTTRIY